MSLPVAGVTRAARPHLVRAAAFGVVALVGAVVASVARGDQGIQAFFADADFAARAYFVVGVVALMVGGVLAARALSEAVRASTQAQLDAARGLPLAKIVKLIGYVVVALWTLGTLGLDFDALLLGGALSGVVLGIAAQQTLGNVFAGVVLMIVRPFTVGENAVLRSTLGEYSGLVTDIGMFYVTIETDRGRVTLPNAVALASAVGPGARAPKDESDEPDKPDKPEDPERPEQSA